MSGYAEMSNEMVQLKANQTCRSYLICGILGLLFWFCVGAGIWLLCGGAG